MQRPEAQLLKLKKQKACGVDAAGLKHEIGGCP
jgi:hypothetical protein